MVNTGYSTAKAERENVSRNRRNESKFHDDSLSLTPAVKSYREHGLCGPEKQNMVMAVTEKYGCTSVQLALRINPSADKTGLTA